VSSRQSLLKFEEEGKKEVSEGGGREEEKERGSLLRLRGIFGKKRWRKWPAIRAMETVRG